MPQPSTNSSPAAIPAKISGSRRHQSRRMVAVGSRRGGPKRPRSWGNASCPRLRFHHELVNGTGEDGHHLPVRRGVYGLLHLAVGSRRRRWSSAVFPRARQCLQRLTPRPEPEMALTRPGSRLSQATRKKKKNQEKKRKNALRLPLGFTLVRRFRLNQPRSGTKRWWEGLSCLAHQLMAGRVSATSRLCMSLETASARLRPYGRCLSRAGSRETVGGKHGQAHEIES